MLDNQEEFWEELYKVIDSSDVLCFIPDARDQKEEEAKH